MSAAFTSPLPLPLKTVHSLPRASQTRCSRSTLTQTSSVSILPASDVRGPFCPLLSRAILRHYIGTRPSPRASWGAAEACDDALERAKYLVKHGRRSEAEWLYARLVRMSASAPAAFALALVAQRRDVELARYAFQVAVDASTTECAVSTYLVSWGLFEAKQGGRRRALALLRRGVLLDERKAPVLRWRPFVEGE